MQEPVWGMIRSPAQTQSQKQREREALAQILRDGAPSPVTQKQEQTPRDSSRDANESLKRAWATRFPNSGMSDQRKKLLKELSDIATPARMHRVAFWAEELEVMDYWFRQLDRPDVRPRFRKAGAPTARARTKKLIEIMNKLRKHFLSLPIEVHEELERLRLVHDEESAAMRIPDPFKLFNTELPLLIKVATEAERRLSRSDSEAEGNATRKRATWIVNLAAKAYEDLTGNSAGRVYNPVTNEENGAFLNFLRKVIGILRVTSTNGKLVSAVSQTRALLRREARKSATPTN
jgi:hypothetical protein